MANVRVVLHHAEIAHLTSWAGEVGVAVGQLAATTVALQKVYAPKRTGKLAASVHFVRRRFARGIGFDAGSDVSYALPQEQGAGPHIIRAKPGRMLKFNGTYAHVVHHPGNPATHFLERGMDQAVREWSG